MSYIKAVLLPGEKVLYKAAVHWIVYAKTFTLLCLAFSFFGLGLWLGIIEENSVWRTTLEVVGYLCGGGAMIAFISGLIERQCTELALTDRRVIAKVGFIRRNASEMRNTKIEGVDVDQSIVGRILGFGTVTVRGTGGGTAPLNKIDDPIAFRKRVAEEAAGRPTA